MDVCPNVKKRFNRYKKKSFILLSSFFAILTAIPLYVLYSGLLENNIIIRSQIKNFGVGGVTRNVSIGKSLNSLVNNFTTTFEDRTPLNNVFIEIKFKDSRILNRSIDRALELGYIDKSCFEKVSARLTYKNSSFDCKLRIKGAYLDHVSTDKISLAIKLSNGHLFGFNKFTINSPMVRDYHTTLLISESMRFKNVLTPQTIPINVFINGFRKGIMYLEQAFDERLTEDNKMPYGPILTFDEKENTVKFEDDSFFNIGNSDLIWSAGNYEKYFQNPGEYSHAFMLEDWARYYAVTTLYKSWHGNVKINLYFYFNPITKKFSPISFDNSCGMDLEASKRNYLPLENEFFHHLLEINEFKRLYIEEVKWWLNNPLAKSHLNKLKSLERIFRGQLILEHPFVDKYLINTKHLTAHIKNIEETEFSTYENIEKVPSNNFPTVFWDLADKQLSIQTNLYDKDKYIINQIFFPPELDHKTIPEYFNNKNIVEGNYLSNATYSVSEVDGKLKNKTFKFKNKVSKIISHPYVVSRTSIIKKYFKVNKARRLITAAGTITINDSLVLPQNYSFRVEAGSRLLFSPSKYLVVNGNLVAVGTSSDPIIFSCSDPNQYWGGLLIIGNRHTFDGSYIEYGFADGNHDDFQLRGSFTVYGCDVKLKNSKIFKNNCEDLLNFTKCSGMLEEVEISDSKSDGLDIDFSEFTIDQLSCSRIGKQTGSDAFDFSGSLISISKCKLKSFTDKGISVGEKSDVKILDTTIRNGLVGIACKDSSNVEVFNTTIQNTKMAKLMAYIKKEHFGGAIIKCRDVNVSQSQCLVTKGSSIFIDDTEVAKSKVAINELYDDAMLSVK